MLHMTCMALPLEGPMGRNIRSWGGQRTDLVIDVSGAKVKMFWDLRARANP